MTYSENLRKIVKSHYLQGKKCQEIYHALAKKVKKRSIFQWMQLWSKGKQKKSKKTKGRPRTVRSKKLVQKVKKSLERTDQRKSMRQLARENSCDKRTIAKIVYEDLGLKKYTPTVVPRLSAAQKAKRLTCARWWRKNYTQASSHKIMFSDEKWFDADGQINSKNDVVYANTREEADLIGGLHEVDKYPLKSMCFLAATMNGFSEPVFLPPKTSFNSDFYIDGCMHIIKRDGRKLIGDDFIFQQDGAKAHTANKSLLAFENWGIRIIQPCHWPPNSPDLNPLDYFVWNEVAKRMPKKKFSNRQQLESSVKKAIKEIPLEMVQESIKKFLPRVLAVEKNLGGRINRKLFTEVMQFFDFTLF